MLVARLEPLLALTPSSLECERDLERELELDLDLEVLLLSVENEASDKDEASLGSSPVNTGLKRQKYFRWPFNASTWPL